jgi:2-polyprenyl-3-methyl-5-hydroxy-6-metoxy-1,4-benzoquinol methylase
MISVAHRTGLFDLMADGVARTSQQIADEAGLHERDVREWLGAMVTSQIVERDPTAQTHRLPPEHAVWLCRKSPTSNLATFARYLPILAQVEEPILNCFKNGGGVPYSAFPRFQDVMAEDSGQSIVPIIVEKVVALFPGLHEDLSSGIDVLDIGCGKGLAISRLAQAYPKSRFVGYDLMPQAVADSKERA